MKSAAIIIFLMSFGSSAFAYCLFGDHLIQAARMKDLTFSKEKVIKLNSNLAFKEVKQIINGTGVSSLKEAFDDTDNGEFLVRTITGPNEKVYKMYIYSAGDTVVGFFIDNKTSDVVAEVDDGEIHQCKVNYEDYDSLQWFYTN